MVGGTLEAGRTLLTGLSDCITGRLARMQRNLQAWLLGGDAISPLPARPAPAGPQATVEAAKYGADRDQRPAVAPRIAAAPPPTAAPTEERLVAVARDPWSLFVYWDISAARRIARLRALGPAAEGAVATIRVRARPDGPWRLFEVPAGVSRQYVTVDPGTTWDVELGLRTRAGAFVRWLAAGDPVSTPPAAASADTSVRWMAVRPGGAAVPATRSWNGSVVEPAGGPAPLPASHSLPSS